MLVEDHRTRRSRSSQSKINASAARPALRTVRRFSKSRRASKKRILCSVFAWCSRRPTPRGMIDTLCTGRMPDSLGVPPWLLAATSLQEGPSTGGSLLFEGGVRPRRMASRDRPMFLIRLSYACDDLVHALLIQQSDSRYGRHAHNSAAAQRSVSSSSVDSKRVGRRAKSTQRQAARIRW